MPNADSEDEFDALPDELEGIDFSTIPALTQDPASYWPSSASGRASSNSSNYDFDDELDDTLLAQVDALEAQALLQVPEAGGSRQPIVGQSSSCEHMARHSQSPAEAQQGNAYSSKRPCPFSPPSSRKKSGKAKELGSAEACDVTALFEIIDNEVCCPICCDTFVAAHLGNPCGHSYCGDCGYAWVSQNKRSPTCPVCRSKLKPSQPLLPNFSVDNVVQAHIRTQALAGLTEWSAGGSKLTEWNARFEKWKLSGAAEKGRKTNVTSSRGRQTTPQIPTLAAIQYMQAFDVYVVPDDDDDDDPTWQEEHFIPHNVQPGQGQRPTTRRSARADVSW